MGLSKASILATGLAFLSVAGLERSAAAGSGNLYGREYLFPGQSLVSPGCFVHLDMQSDGNLVVYDGNQAIWATNTNGRGAYAAMQMDGNFVVYNWSNEALFATNTSGFNGHLSMQDDSNLVVYDVVGNAEWANNFHYSQVSQTCNRAESSTWMASDFDIPGDDYAVYQISFNAPTYCAYWCGQDSRCQSFTHVPAGVEGANAMCHLKNGNPAISSAPGRTSGRVNR